MTIPAPAHLAGALAHALRSPPAHSLTRPLSDRAKLLCAAGMLWGRVVRVGRVVSVQATRSALDAR